MNKKLTINFIVLMMLAFFVKPAFSTEKNFTANIGSFLYHPRFIFRSGSDFTEGFDNEYLALGYRIGDKSHFNVGTLLNSQGNRCLLTGVQRSWHRFSDKLEFEGFYGYVGEFFFSAFDDCADRGVYRQVEEAVGIPGVPYIYHGLEYHFFPNVGLEFGIILPGLIVATLQFSF